MDDAKYWHDMTFRGEPVAHCRAKVADGQKKLLDRRHREDRRLVQRASR